MPTPTY
jgi:NAD(P)-dependent dehydrogenase (short-subunit alcohol dehydrogenase family)